eukprot:7727753-Alexandrium_andersonii.AAC.1
MGLAATLERDKLRGHTVAVAAFDMFKSFDQICRPLLYAVLGAMGLPTGVLGAYGRHMEALRVRGVYARSVGAPADRQAA